MDPVCFDVQPQIDAQPIRTPKRPHYMTNSNLDIPKFAKKLRTELVNELASKNKLNKKQPQSKCTTNEDPVSSQIGDHSLKTVKQSQNLTNSNLDTRKLSKKSRKKQVDKSAMAEKLNKTPPKSKSLTNVGGVSSQIDSQPLKRIKRSHNMTNSNLDTRNLSKESRSFATR